MNSKRDRDNVMERLDDRPSDREVPKWVKSGTWIGAILVSLPVLYFLVYPGLAITIYRSMGFPDPVPPLLESSIVPIEWMGEKSNLYGDYTDWLSDLLL